MTRPSRKGRPATAWAFVASVLVGTMSASGAAPDWYVRRATARETYDASLEKRDPFIMSTSP